MQQQSVSCQQTHSGSSVTAWPGALTQKAAVPAAVQLWGWKHGRGIPAQLLLVPGEQTLCAGSCFFPGKPRHSGVRRMKPCKSKVFVFCWPVP